MLVMDGYGSHLTFRFKDYAANHDIVLCQFPGHLTHTLQPLDVCAFQPFKHYHMEAIFLKSTMQLTAATIAKGSKASLLANEVARKAADEAVWEAGMNARRRKWRM